MKKINFLDCTLRDGGYYNAWDFDTEVINEYVNSVISSGVNHIEIGFRSISNKDFKGPFAYSTDEFIKSLKLPKKVTLGVMINASDIIVNNKINSRNLNLLIEKDSRNSPITLIRIACHYKEFEIALRCVKPLVRKGYKIGFNIMQVGDRSEEELEKLSKLASKHPISVLYFADSMGNMDNQKVLSIINSFKKYWKGDIGIHAHDNMGLALSNTLFALKNGVNWVDSTITGMGRGAGNVKTELLAIEIAEINKKEINLLPILSIIKRYFGVLKDKFQWGVNPSYYLSGKYGIHPTYIQEMLLDRRFDEEDIIASIENLRKYGGKKFSKSILLSTREFYTKKPIGKWKPLTKFKNKDLLLLAPGNNLKKHKYAVEKYIKTNEPVVIALNTNEIIKEDLVKYRIACHPLRLASDYKKYQKKSQPLIAPVSMLPKKISDYLMTINTLDYGLCIDKNKFNLSDTFAYLPNSLVITYALAIAFSGKVKNIYLAGFDGYLADDPRRNEVDEIINLYKNLNQKINIYSVTPTLYNINVKSIYGL